ncbi:alkaline phosphatase family protein [Micromonospora chokoriensis]
MKALILGIDGGSLSLLSPLMAEGRLPNLSRLLGQSRYGTTKTTWPAHTAPGWSTFVTARSPGGHGVYQFFGTQERDYGARLTGTGDFGCSTLWEWLAAQGLSAGIINVPMSHPPRELPGYQVTWPLEQTLRFSRPGSLLAELARAGAPFAPDIMTMFGGDHSYLDGALANVGARGRSVRYLLDNHPVDVVMAVLTEVDRICHHYWHFADGCHPSHRQPDEPRWADAMRLVHEAVDAVFGEILEAVGDEVPVLVLSDHGLGEGRLNLGVNSVLAEAGLLRLRTGRGEHATWFDGVGNTVDFGATRAYMPTPGCYGVNLNLRGRQRDGTVRPSEATVLREEIGELFLSLRAPDTGERVFAAALPSEEAYPGPMSSRAPDLLLIPADEGVLADPGITGGRWRPSEQTGMHRYAGMWAYRSPRVSPGPHPDPVALCDLAPTLLADLGLRFPAAVHGRPIPEVLEANGSPLPYLPDPGAPEASAADTARILHEDDLTARSLSAMGYL